MLLWHPRQRAAISPSTITATTTTRLHAIVAANAVGANVQACATVTSRR
jgi:hypothetical protein